MIGIALYKPDIPQNTAAIMRFASCFGMKIHIIEPCSFRLDDKRFTRVVMDYMNINHLRRYSDFKNFKDNNKKSRIILLTTKSRVSYLDFKFKKDDILLLGRESKGVPEELHSSLKYKLKIPISKNTRSLNVAISGAVASAEALRQNNFL